MRVNKVRGIPDLVAKVTVAFHTFHIEANSARSGSNGIKSEPQRICAVSGNAFRIFLARRLGDAFCHSRLHHVSRSLGNQIIKGYSVNDIQWVEPVPLGFGHLLPLGIGHEAVDINLVKGYLADEFERHHDHSGNPEADDVVTGDHDVR